MPVQRLGYVSFWFGALHACLGGADTLGKAFLLLKHIMEEDIASALDLARSVMLGNCGSHLVTMRGNTRDTMKTAKGRDGKINRVTEPTQEALPSTPLVTVMKGGRQTQMGFPLPAAEGPTPHASCDKIVVQSEPGGPQGRNRVFPSCGTFTNPKLALPFLSLK